jgi:hypothetical protein
MTVWASSPAVKTNPTQGDLRPDVGFRLDAPVTRRPSLCLGGSSFDPKAEERPECVKTPRIPGVTDGVRPRVARSFGPANVDPGADPPPALASPAAPTEAIASASIEGFGGRP